MSFTGVPEMNMMILKNMDYDELKPLYYSRNTYLYSLLHDPYFWFQKFKQEGLVIPSVFKHYQDLESPMFNWLLAYDVLLDTNLIIDKLKSNVVKIYLANDHGIEILHDFDLYNNENDIYELKIMKAAYPYVGYIILTDRIYFISEAKLRDLQFTLDYEGSIE
jgi:hypothetical protein